MYSNTSKRTVSRLEFTHFLNSGKALPKTTKKGPTIFTLFESSFNTEAQRQRGTEIDLISLPYWEIRRLGDWEIYPHASSLSSAKFLRRSRDHESCCGGKSLTRLATSQLAVGFDACRVTQSASPHLKPTAFAATTDTKRRQGSGTKTPHKCGYMKKLRRWANAQRREGTRNKKKHRWCAFNAATRVSLFLA